MSNPMQLNGGSGVAMKGRDCIAIASDLRLGNNNMSLSSQFRKVFRVSDTLYYVLCGLATDVITVSTDLRYMVNMYRMKEHREVSVETFTYMLSSMQYKKRFGSFFVEPLTAGFDKKGKPYVACLDNIGCISVAPDFAATGTASDKLMGVAEALWEPELEPDALLETISQTLLNGIDRDALSGWGAEVTLITKTEVRVVSLKGRMD